MTMEYQILQLWPSGKSVRFAGDYPNYIDSEGNEFPPETQDEIRVEVLAEIYLDRDVLQCQSALVDELIRKGNVDGFSYDDYETSQSCSDWDFASLREYADDHYLDVDAPTLQEFLDGAPTAEQIKDRLAEEGDGFDSFAVGVSCENPGEWELVIDDVSAYWIEVDTEVVDRHAIDFSEVALALQEEIKSKYDEDDFIDELRESVQDHMNESPTEVYEWWLVSSWLADKFKEIGEIVLDNGYGYWWGRTCTGQSMIMDGTLQRIAQRWVTKNRMQPA